MPYSGLYTPSTPVAGKLLTPQPHSAGFVLRTPNAEQWHLKKRTSISGSTPSLKNNIASGYISGNSSSGIREPTKQKPPISSLVTNTYTPPSKNINIQNSNQYLQLTPPLFENGSSESDESDVEKQRRIKICLDVPLLSDPL